MTAQTLDILQPPAFILAIAWLVSLVTSSLKGPVEKLLPPANRWHDLVFTLLPVALSLALVLGYTLTHGGDVFLACVWGTLSGFGAVGSYVIHARSGSGSGASRGPSAGASGPPSP